MRAEGIELCDTEYRIKIDLAKAVKSRRGFEPANAPSGQWWEVEASVVTGDRDHEPPPGKLTSKRKSKVGFAVGAKRAPATKSKRVVSESDLAGPFVIFRVSSAWARNPTVCVRARGACACCSALASPVLGFVGCSGRGVGKLAVDWR